MMKLRRDVFQGLSDPTRRSIVLLLASQAMTAGVIAGNFDAARPTISKHIQVLCECDLVKSEQHGREITYQLNVAKLKDIDLWLEQLKNVWETRFDQLDNILFTVKNKSNES